MFRWLANMMMTILATLTQSTATMAAWIASSAPEMAQSLRAVALGAVMLVWSCRL